MRPVLYQLCRAGECFEVGDGPLDLSESANIVIGRGDPQYTRHGQYLVDDEWMSSNHAEIMVIGDRFVLRDTGSTNGVLVNGTRVLEEELQDGDLIETGRTFWLFRHEPSDLALPQEPVEFGSWTTWSPRLAQTLLRLERRVRTKAHLLMVGPAGVGKGFLSRTVHLMSARPGRMVHLDCAERSDRQLKADLFGDEQKRARLLDADVGTLFLENVDQLPVALQDKLGHALQRASFVPRGKKQPVTIDVRLVASSRRDRERAIAAGAMSEDFAELFGRRTIDLPGVDDRRCDLGLLLDDFLARARGAEAISRDAARAILSHDWPMHVKALASVIEAAAILARGDDSADGVIEMRHLPRCVGGNEPFAEEMTLHGGILPTELPSEIVTSHEVDEDDVVADETVPMDSAKALDVLARPASGYHDIGSLERSYANAVDPQLISAALRRSHGNVSAAARYLGRPRALVLKWMREFDLDQDEFRP